MSLKNITIVGASGNLGKGILPHLFAASSLNITLLARSTSSAQFPAGAKVIRSDFSLASLTEVLKGQDAVISLMPIPAAGEQVTVIEAAIAAGVKRFIPSEFGSDNSNPAIVAAVPFFETKQKSLEFLKSKQDAITWTAVITGPFFDWGLFEGMIGFNLSTKTASLIDGGTSRFSATTIAQIARSLIAILAHADATANQTVFIESFTTNQLEVLAALEKATGEKWNRGPEVKGEDVRAAGLKAMGEGDILGG
ncbi:isoflavone reductase, partial [Leptodontidium sp. 2 PMI_412]